MRAHPNHVLRMLASASSASPNAAVTLPPTADLHRGKIYFLVPAPPPPPPPPPPAAKKAGGTGTRRRRRKKKEAALGGDVNGEGEKARLLLVNERISFCSDFQTRGLLPAAPAAAPVIATAMNAAAANTSMSKEDTTTALIIIQHVSYPVSIPGRQASVSTVNRAKSE
ncbi:hypothetical protein ZIOFF_068751 [Zingiber officinale]|uniref:Uncharacterized protein n=1 Tax=Zingiber officinale TaxID=94328 RepID=A0A8J5C364_ZINOF|nr:hypothetical protein ZIOFF_068751 [Zingiber officinale]